MDQKNLKVVDTQGLATTLPKFDQTIEIKVSVDSIYQKLLSTFPEEYKHKEILAHAIVGTSKDNGAIGYIYNALNGYPNVVDFKKGDQVVCNLKQKRRTWSESAAPGVKSEVKRETVVIGDCEVIDVDLYGENNLKIEFQQDNYDGTKKEMMQIWVNHKTCAEWMAH